MSVGSVEDDVGGAKTGDGDVDAGDRHECDYDDDAE